MTDKRIPISVVLGLILCVGVWLAVPYNNYLLNNTFICDSYLPEIVLLCLVVLVVVVNPLLQRWRADWVLEYRHLALIAGMLFFAAVIPSGGLMRSFPHCLALDTEMINQSRVLAPAIENSGLPATLFPDRIGVDVETPVSGQLVDELEPGATIPWSAWLWPLVTWGTLIVALWVLMVGLGLIVFPQWLAIERLPFPLLKVYDAILGGPAGGGLPPLFRTPVFWIACGTVLVIHSSQGLAIFTDGAFPALPVSWNMSEFFTEGIWVYTPGFLKSSRIYFLFVGLAFFMPVRYSFSIWFTVLFFGVVVMVGQMYVPTFQTDLLYDQGSGALIALALGVVWLGRQHYWQVLRATLGRTGGGAEVGAQSLAGRLFFGGCAVVLLWFVWAGAGWFWAVLFVVTAVIIMLVVTRIVAETGITYIWIISLTAGRLMSFFPAEWKSVAATFLQSAHYVLVNRASAVSVAAMTVLALALNRASTPGTARRVAGLGVLVLVVGLLVCGAVHLNMGYHFASSLDGVNTPITGRGAQMMSLEAVNSFVAGQKTPFPAERFQVLLFGAALAGGLLFLCARFPGWPLHPIGLLFVYSSIGLRVFMSLFVGWLIKTLLVQCAGARAFHVAQPFFLGLIMGEVLANVLWTLVPVGQMLLGADPSTIRHLVIFQSM